MSSSGEAIASDYQQLRQRRRLGIDIANNSALCACNPCKRAGVIA
jgi:hypothetical protein